MCTRTDMQERTYVDLHDYIPWIAYCHSTAHTGPCEILYAHSWWEVMKLLIDGMDIQKQLASGDSVEVE